VAVGHGAGHHCFDADLQRVMVAQRYRCSGVIAIEYGKASVCAQCPESFLQRLLRIWEVTEHRIEGYEVKQVCVERKSSTVALAKAHAGQTNGACLRQQRGRQIDPDHRWATGPARA